MWLLLAALALVGGLAYVPNNYDYLTYRFPRVLSWTWDHQWHWITTINERLNYSGTGFEWIMAPLFIVFQTDRLFFLINFFSYLFLPGLIFSVFRAMGISPRVSWWWMWVLPSGYCYILQAASVGNDSFSAVYFLASLHYLLAQDPRRGRNFAFSLLAIALATGTKASNLPLVLPWLIALFFRREIITGQDRGELSLSVLALPIAAVVSFLPLALLNIHFTGDFTGDSENSSGMKARNPIGAFAGNSLQLAKDNLAPPVLPLSIDWSQLLPAGARQSLQRDFSRLDLHSDELQIEEAAGVGLGIVLATAFFVIWGAGARIVTCTNGAPRRVFAWLWTAGVLVAWLTYMAKLESEAASRLVAAYYAPLVAGILIVFPRDGRVVKRAAFQWLGLVVVLSAFPVVILTPSRPLFPVDGVGRLLEFSHVSAGAVRRYHDVYAIYAGRSNVFRGLAAELPAGERTVGLIQNGNAPMASLWRPFGSRAIVEINPGETREELEAKGIRSIVVSGDALDNIYHLDLDAVMAKWNARQIAETKLTLTAHRGPEAWYILVL